MTQEATDRTTRDFLEPTTLVIDFDSNLPGTLGECGTIVLKLGRREVSCSKEELFDAIERLLHG